MDLSNGGMERGCSTMYMTFLISSSLKEESIAAINIPRPSNIIAEFKCQYATRTSE